MAKRPRPTKASQSGRDSSGPHSPAAHGPTSAGRSLGAAALNAGGSRAGRSGSSGSSGSSGPSDAAARARARRRAAETPRRAWRERPGVLLAIGVAVIAVALGGLAFLAWRQSGPPSSQVAGTVDWAANPPGLQDRLTAAHLPALAAEGEALHIHQHLDLYLNGEHVPVPADIGIDQSAGILSPIHTHDDTGVIHVESPTVQEFTLSQFFQVWGVDLSPLSIGQYKVDATHVLRMWVNGQLYTGDPGSLALQEHQEIVIAYGTAAEMPNPAPSSYAWPQGL